MMFKKIIMWFLALAIMFGSAGCGLFMDLPSVCDDKKEPSVLCDIAAKAGVRLEDAGNLLIIVNAIAIHEGTYTIEQAITVLKGLRNTITGNVTYLIIRGKVEQAIINYPGLFAVTEIYINGFNSEQVILDKDRRMLIAWLDARIKSLENFV